MKTNYRLFEPVDELNPKFEERNLNTAQLKSFVLEFAQHNKQDASELVSADLPIFLTNYLRDQFIATATDMEEFVRFEDVREEYHHVVDLLL